MLIHSGFISLIIYASFKEAFQATKQYRRTSAVASLSDESHFRNLINLLLFFIGKRDILQRLNIIQNLRRLGGAD